MRFETNRINGETPILELKNISVKYGSIKALRDINLSINLGEIHAVVGEHGAGKSTLAQIVSNLIQPASGQVLLNGNSLAISPDKQEQHFERCCNMASLAGCDKTFANLATSCNSV